MLCQVVLLLLNANDIILFQITTFMMLSLFSTVFASVSFIGSIDMAFDMYNADEPAEFVQQVSKQ